MEKCKFVDDAWQLYNLVVLSSLNTKSQKIETQRWEQHISPILGKKQLKKLTSFDYWTLRRAVEEKKLSPQTVYHCLSLLRRVLNKAAEWETPYKNVASFKGIMPKFDNNRLRFLSKPELNTILNILKINSTEWYNITLFAVNTGLRKSEIFDLEFQHINQSLKMINVVETKSCRNRTLPLNSLAYSSIEEKLNKKHAPFDKVFTGRYSKKFSSAIKKSGLNEGITDPRQKIVFHSLRHTFASWLVQEGVPLAHVSKLLGHSSIRVTMRYAHLAPASAKIAVDIVSNNILNS